MKRPVRVKFYRVEREKPDQPGFSDCLLALDGIPVDDREYEVDDHHSVTVDRLIEEKGGIISGEVVRHQKGNFPSHTRRGQRPAPLDLGEDGALGHHAAFRYYPEIHLLAFQAASQAARPAALGGYMRKQLRCKGFAFRPLVSKDAWERLRAGTPKVIRAKVANPANLALVEGLHSPLVKSIRDLTQKYGGMSIDIVISVEHSKTETLETDEVIHAVEELYELREREAISIDALQVRSLTENGVDPIDFFGGSLLEEDEIELDDADVDGHYEARRKFLSRACLSRWDELLEQLKQ